MKFYFLAIGVAVLVTACNNSPKAEETTSLLKSDSTFVLQPELPVTEEASTPPASTVEKQSVAPQTTNANNAVTTNSAGTSQSSNTASAKKGWSKTAKGAVIGGVVGAGTGAIINKRNRGAGAVIGGVIGAGTGAIIGNEMDKKDGRH